MSARSLIAGGAPPSFAIVNPATADDGKMLAYAAATKSCTWAPVTAAPVVSTGTLNWVGSGTSFLAAGYTAIVTTLSDGKRLVWLSVEGTSTPTIFGAAVTILTAKLPNLGSALTTYVGTAWTVVTTSQMVAVYVGTSGGDQVIALRNPTSWATSIGQILAFNVSYQLPPLPEVLTAIQNLPVVSEETAEEPPPTEDLFELQGSGAEETAEEPPDLFKLLTDPDGQDASGEVSDTGSDFSFAGLE